MNMKAVYVIFASLAVAEGVFVNEFDKQLHFECPHSTQTISRVKSEHSNHYEDRRFDITCRDVLKDLAGLHAKCQWTGYMNNYDAPVHFSCPNTHYMSGIDSIHSNHDEDRKWKFYCCEIQGYHQVDCSLSGYVNDYDQVSDFQVHTDKVMKGMNSVHSNHYEDRKFEFETCTLRQISNGVIG